MLQWVASIDVVENEEASASVVVKMTDSFTEQADQVILISLTVTGEAQGRFCQLCSLSANSKVLWGIT